MSDINNLPSLSEKMADAVNRLDPGTRFIKKIQNDIERLSTDIYLAALMGKLQGDRDILPENRSSGSQSFRIITQYQPKNDTATHYHLQISLVGVDLAHSSEKTQKQGILDKENHLRLTSLNLAVHKTDGTAHDRARSEAQMDYADTQDAITDFILTEISKHMTLHQFETFTQRMKWVQPADKDAAKKPAAGL